LRDLRAGRSFIDQQLEAGSDEQPTLVLLLLAVSRFDAINAAFGRSTGDTVLQARDAGSSGWSKPMASAALSPGSPDPNSR
jgi:predicted signal transduction protein with EAL and GGDEF domain